MVRLTWCGALAVMLLGLPARAQDEVRIGAVLPVTGKESKIGSAYKQATELAVKEVNDAGGVPSAAKKMKVDLSPARRHVGRGEERAAGRTAHHPNQSRTPSSAATARIWCKPSRWCPSATASPTSAGGAGATRIFGRSKWVFGTLSPVEHLADDADEVPGRTSYATGKLKTPLSIALVTEQTEHGNDYAKGVKEYIGGHPGYEASRWSRSSSSTPPDFRPLLGRVQAAKTDLFMADAHLEDFISHAADVCPDGAPEPDDYVRRSRCSDSRPERAWARPRTISLPAAGGRTSCPTPR